MHTQRFGRKLKLPSTIAIKHGLIKLMLQDQLAADAAASNAQAPAPSTNESLVAPNPGAPKMVNGTEAAKPKHSSAI